MTGSAGRRLRGSAAIFAVLSPVVSHIALALGQGYGVAVGLAGVQAAASGILVGGLPVPYRWAGVPVCLLLWAALALGGRDGAAAALLAEAGVAHALLYGALLVGFGRSLRPGRVELVTWAASRINPHFHAGQVGYTRAVTWGWVGVFAGELVGSAALLVWVPARWAGFVTSWHAGLPVGFMLIEVVVRRWRWRNEHATGLLETIRGMRRLMR